jgi:hypothetical protein
MKETPTGIIDNPKQVECKCCPEDSICKRVLCIEEMVMVNIDDIKIGNDNNIDAREKKWEY